MKIVISLTVLIVCTAIGSMLGAIVIHFFRKTSGGISESRWKENIRGIVKEEVTTLLNEIRSIHKDHL